MFDINNIVNAAINAAVNARLTEVLQQHANTIAPLMDQIHNLDAICQTQHEAMVAMRDRIAALENNPAQGVDTQAEYATAHDIKVLREQLGALGAAPTTGLTRDDVAALIEAAMDDHCSTYDHDDYDNAVSKVDDLPDLDDYVTRDEVRSEIEDVLNNATLSLSI